MTQSNTPPQTSEGGAHQGKQSLLDRYFSISARGSNITREVRGGVVTFFAMAYIIVLNPLILSGVADRNGNELQGDQIAAVTALVAGVMTILFGVVARYPFAIATGLGINTLTAVTIVGGKGFTWEEAMGLVVIDGLIIVLLAMTGARTAVFNAIPRELKAAITVGIGMFITLIGLVDAGFVRRIPDAAGTTVPVGLGTSGSIDTWPTLVFVLGLIICGLLMVRGVRGGLFIGIIVTAIIAMIVEAVAKPGPSFVDGKPNPGGWNLAVPEVPSSVADLPDLALVGKFDLFGAFDYAALTASLMVFTLVLANFFDAMGTMTGLGKQANLTDKDGNLPNMKTALVVEGVGAVAGGSASASSNTVFVDSAAGIADGARTGLANVVTGALFLLAMFFTPLYSVIPMEAAAPALVIVGALMIAQIREIDLSQLSVALPAFLMIVVMPFTYSIVNGIGAGFVAWVVFQTAAGKARTIHPLLWIVSAAFAVYFGIGPISDAIG